MQTDKQYTRDKRSPKPKSATVSKVMSRNRAKDTGPEILLRKAIRAKGMTGYRLHPANIPGRPDICFVSRKLAIFVNGCFWHSCPKCKPHTPTHNSDFWRNKFSANKARDARKIAELEAKDWHTLTIWECEIKRDLDHMVKIVQDELQNRDIRKK